MLVRPWFVGMLVLFTMHQIIEKFLGIQILLLDSFLDPLLFMPILLHLMLWERRYIFGKGADYIFSWQRIACIWFFVSLLCELLFPYWTVRFTMDYWDILCYSIGALVYGICFNKPEEATRQEV